MPIYVYRCDACGHQEEFLQKVSDPQRTRCTSCGKEALSKMVTAAGFQLKGSGWYATDFKASGSKPDAAPAPADKKGEAKTEGAPAGSKAEAKADAKPEAKPEAKKEAAPASGTTGTTGTTPA
jgi:putative FmdB family regulatory protein